MKINSISKNIHNNFNKPLTSTIILLISFIMMSGLGAATDFTVDQDFETTGDNEFTSIQAAVDAAESGDTIEVTSGTYDELIRTSVEGLELVAPNGATIQPSQETVEDAGRTRVVDLGGDTHTTTMMLHFQVSKLMVLTQMEFG